MWETSHESHQIPPFPGLFIRLLSESDTPCTGVWRPSVDGRTHRGVTLGMPPKHGYAPLASRLKAIEKGSQLGPHDKKLACAACGAISRYRAVDRIDRDKGSFNCGCGAELLSWNGAVSYSFQRVKAGRAAKMGRKG